MITMKKAVQQSRQVLPQIEKLQKTNSSQKKSLVNNNNIQHIKNNQLKLKNDILILEIQSAQSSDEHIENFARERLGLTYPDEEFISFEKKKDDEK